jgi:hypothetical protein
MVEMFQYPTVNSMSEHEDKKSKTPFSMDKIQERAARQKTAMNSQKPPERGKKKG